VNRPIDPYSQDWHAYWLAHPYEARGVGADAVDESAQGEEGEAAEAEGATGDGTSKEGEQTETKAADAKDEDWRADLPEDLRKTADRYTSKADAVRAIDWYRRRDSQARVPGTEKVIKTQLAVSLGRDPTEAEVKDTLDKETAAYRKAVGIPEAPEGYEFPSAKDDAPEVIEGRAAWAKTFHELGVTKDQANALIERVRAENERSEAAQVEADKAFAKAQEDALKAEWKGEDYDRNKTLAKRAVTEVANRSGIAVDDLARMETKEGRFLLDDARMLKLFATIGREMAEGTLGPALNEGERDSVENEIEDLRRQINEALQSGNSKRANTLYQREQALIKKMGGSGPIVGAQGRAA
jgi:hypothetical protein